MHTSIKDNHSNSLRELQMKLLSTTQLKTSEKDDRSVAMTTESTESK